MPSKTCNNVSNKGLSHHFLKKAVENFVKVQGCVVPSFT